MLNDKVIAEEDLVALENIAEASFFKKLWHHLQRFFSSLFGKVPSMQTSIAKSPSTT